MLMTDLAVRSCRLTHSGSLKVSLSSRANWVHESKSFMCQANEPLRQDW